MHRRPNLAIDGPAASGKTTVARLLARQLGLVYLDTGAMYRAVTWKALQDGVSLNDEAALVALAEELDLGMEPDPSSSTGHRISVEGADITGELHLPEVSRAVPKVASVPGVRRELVRRQQELTSGGGVIMAGRDIGTVVMPDARLKFYMDADLGERARRRQRDLAEEGRPYTVEEVATQLRERDGIDSSRDDSPLRPAEDAELLDCTRLAPQEVVGRIVARYQQALRELDREGPA